MENGLDVHGIRLDIYAGDEDGTVYEVEMQVIVKKNLRKRSRYYGSVIDTHMLAKGKPYEQLKDVYVIFICPEDLFGKGLHKYTFKNICEEDTQVKLDDGSVKIFLNAAGVQDDVGGSLKAFLDYVAGKASDDPYVKKVDAAVREAKKNKEWRREYMMWEAVEAQKEWDIREDERTRRDTERISSMLKRGKSPEAIAEFCGYPLEQVLGVQKEMNAEMAVK